MSISASSSNPNVLHRPPFGFWPVLDRSIADAQWSRHPPHTSTAQSPATYMVVLQIEDFLDSKSFTIWVSSICGPSSLEMKRSSGLPHSMSFVSESNHVWYPLATLSESLWRVPLLCSIFWWKALPVCMLVGFLLNYCVTSLDLITLNVSVFNAAWMSRYIITLLYPTTVSPDAHSVAFISACSILLLLFGICVFYETLRLVINMLISHPLTMGLL